MYTRHAQTRCQQRGIRAQIVEVLLAYGQRAHRRGAHVYYMDRQTRAHAAKELGRDAFRKIADKLDTYIVVSESGTLITAAKRRRRFRR